MVTSKLFIQIYKRIKLLFFVFFCIIKCTQSQKFICKRESDKQKKITDGTMTRTVIERIIDIHNYIQKKNQRQTANCSSTLCTKAKRKTRTINQINKQQIS